MKKKVLYKKIYEMFLFICFAATMIYTSDAVEHRKQLQDSKKKFESRTGVDSSKIY